MKKKVVIFILIFCSILFSENKINEKSMEKVPNFYATGLNVPSFFLSRHISPKVKPADKTNMLFSFFTTSCIPCRKEIPFLQKYSDQYKIEKIFLINIGEDKLKVKKYIDIQKYNLKVLLDPYAVISKKLGVKSTPYMMIISGDGDLLYQHNGFSENDTTEIIEMINKYFSDSENEF